MGTLSFAKLHGTGNDFVVVDARREPPDDPAALAPRLCDRHRGIGADGLILVLPSAVAACRMAVFNADGSRAEMCGNGIRALAKFVLDRGLARANPLRVETDAGVKELVCVRENGRVTRVTVDMGTPEWEGRRIPVDADGPVIEQSLTVDGRPWTVTCLALGNPHCVVFVDDPGALDLAALGPRFEHHPFFPRRVNTEFVRVVGPERLAMRVWERGAGETQACGTGACAAAVAAARTGRSGRRVEVALPGGILAIDWRADDHVAVVRTVVEAARRRVPVVAGTGSNATAEAIRLTRAAEEAGADAALLISPYYNRPTQEGTVRHYAAVAEATRLPLIPYNIPGRTASNITPDTMARLARIRNVVGVKEASGSLEQVQHVLAACGPDFAVYSGDDVLTLPIMAVGGKGVISVTANVAPRRMADLAAVLLADDLARGRAVMRELLPLMRVLFLEVNPIPVKTALALMGACAEEFRLPLTPMTPANRATLEAVLREQRLV